VHFIQENSYHVLLVSRNNCCLLDHKSSTQLTAQHEREIMAQYNALAITVEALI
jgi:hypothetical protein